MTVCHIDSELNRLYVSRKRNHLLRFNKCRYDANDGDEGDAKCVIVIIIQAPENEAGDLEDVERMDDLRKFLGRKAEQCICTDLIHKK